MTNGKDNNKEANKKNTSPREAYRAAIVYAIFGLLWILLTDVILNTIHYDMVKYKNYQNLKGVFYVLITTFLIYGLTRYRMKLWQIEYKKKEKAYQELRIAHDELISLETELNYQKEFSKNIIEEAPSIIITWDDTGKILSLNPFGERITGYTQKELVNSQGWNVLVPDDRAFLARDTYFDIKDRNGTLLYDGALITKDNKRVDILWSSKILFSLSDAKGNIYVSIGTDIEERKKYEEKIRHMAYNDSLTGLANRFMFEQELSKHISEGEQNFSIVYMDIDNFKNINDSIGHQVGDIFLKYFADSIKSYAGEDTFIARLGGDEFAIIYPCNSRLELKKRVDILLKHINRIWSYNNRMFYISVSVGIVMYPEHGANTLELLKNVDIAMYASKGEGKNRVLFYDDELLEENVRNSDMVNYLQQGIEQEQFYLVYQPQYELGSKELVGMEALLRWEHPKEGFISPAEFIPIAEKTGQIYRLEKLVIRKALEQKMLWEQEGFTGFVLSINLSTKTLTSDINFTEWEQILSNYSVEFSEIVIEITETADIYDIENVIERLSRLKDKGIRIALDDFGTGYSSLNYLKKFPIDIIKLDRSFINSITENGVDTLLIKNIVKLANDLKYDVIAEGIETHEQMKMLVDYKCDKGQGFLLSRPLSVDKILKLLYKKD